MRRWALFGLAAVALATASAAAQSRSKPAPQAPAVAKAVSGDQSIVGTWTYRSFINTAELVGNDPSKALDLIFGEGVFTFESPSDIILTGTFPMGGGYVPDRQGTIRPAAGGAPLTVEITGAGRAGTPTAGPEYDDHADLGYRWPNGLNQVPSLVRTVIRAKPHAGAPAGFVASSIAVKQSRQD